MKTPIYKKYKIYYNGEFLEEISATSKKNVKEYIQDKYNSAHRIDSSNNLGWVKYRLKNFDIVLCTHSHELQADITKVLMFGDDGFEQLKKNHEK